MAAFAPSFRLEQSIDGKTITIIDDSDYAGSDELYDVTDFVRVLDIRDAADTLIESVVLTGLSQTIQLEASLWAHSTVSWTGTGPVVGTNYSKFFIFPLDRIDRHLFMEELAEHGCGEGCSKSTNEAMIHADILFTGMSFAAPAGEGIRWQSYANAAHKFLDSIR